MRSRENASFLRGLGHLLLAEPRPSRGFALLVVLWVLVLVAFLVAQVTAAGRTELRIARNLYANAAAEAALDGAIHEALFHLSDPRPERRWAVDGQHERRRQLRAEAGSRQINGAEVAVAAVGGGTLCGALLLTTH